MFMLPDTASLLKQKEQDRRPNELSDADDVPPLDDVPSLDGEDAEDHDQEVELHVLKQVLLHQDAAVGDSDEAADYREGVDRLLDNMGDQFHADETKEIAEDLLKKLAGAALRRVPKKPSKDSISTFEIEILDEPAKDAEREQAILDAGKQIGWSKKFQISRQN